MGRGCAQAEGREEALVGLTGRVPRGTGGGTGGPHWESPWTNGRTDLLEAGGVGWGGGVRCITSGKAVPCLATRGNLMEMDVGK